MTATCEMRAVTKRYGERVALRGVSLDIRPNEILGLVGPNAAGKTTLVRIAATLLQPDGGTVEICGSDAVADPRAVRPWLAIVPQGAQPDPFATPWEHTFHYLCARGVKHHEASSRAEKVLRDLDIWEHRDLRAQKLSGGYQRRILLAMALAASPRLLLLDEPTTALDPGARRVMWNLLADLRDGTSILLTTHDMHEAEVLSDRIALIADGEIVATGTLDELLATVPAREKFVVEQPPDTLPATLLDRYGTVSRVAGKHAVYPRSEQDSRALASLLLDANARFSVERVDLEDVYFELLAKPSVTGNGGAGRPAG